MTLSNQGKGKRVRFAKGDAKVFADKVATRVANSVVTHLMEGEESSVHDDDLDTDDLSCLCMMMTRMLMTLLRVGTSRRALRTETTRL